MWLEEAEATERDRFEVLLAATEAFANAVEHPQDPRSHVVDVEGAITDQGVIISIRDYGTWASEQTRKEEGGLGLVIIEELMDVVQLECVVDGTTITMRRRLTMH
jgi:anti-sigma regulatory factor (Ser/Thr protein kinase)